MALPTISSGDLTNKGVTGEPANPELSVSALQAKFDELSISVIVPKFQALVTALENELAGADIGATAPTGITSTNKMQTIIDAIASILVALETKSETDYDPLVELLTGITIVTDTVDGQLTSIPTCKAITDFIEDIGGGDMLKATYDSNNDGIVNDSDKLGNQLPAYYATASSLTAVANNVATILTNEAVNEITILTTDWVLDSDVYKAVKTLSGIVNGATPDWCMKIAGKTSTATEKSNDALIETLECTLNTATFYATAVPSATVIYRLKGIKL